MQRLQGPAEFFQRTLYSLADYVGAAQEVVRE